MFPEIMRILTFDIEDWFHILDNQETSHEVRWSNFPSRIEFNLDRIFRILEVAQCKGTFFCLGWIAEKYPHLVRRIADAGYEVACHSHLHQLAYEQTPSQFRSDLRKALDAIRDAAGVCINTYRAPGFSLTKDSLWLLDILAEEGITVDCSVFPAKRSHGGLSEFPSAAPCLIKTFKGSIIKEFPLNVRPFLGQKIVFSGGGYFRIFPYSLIKRLFNQSDYVMTYFHPRDFDPDQPIIPNLSKLRYFKSYIGLSHSENKLVRLLADFEFIDVRTAVSDVDWLKVKTIIV